MVRAVVVDEIRSEAGQQPGAIEFRELGGKVCGIAFRCPCGCGFDSWLPLGQEQRGWEWNGSREAASTTPSILQSGLPCKWHGYLTDGEFRPC
jgi:hypothetical protein